VYERAIQEGVKRLLIFEDDVVFDKKFRAQESEAIAAISGREWDIVHFGYAACDPPPESARGLCKSPAAVMGLHFYAMGGEALPVFARGVRELLSRPPGHPLGGPMHVDGALCHVREANPDLKAFVYCPTLGDQSNSPSDIAGWRWWDRFPVIRTVSSFARLLRDLAPRGA
jgi:hypothetical protein